MRVVLTVWDGRISPVLDVAREALVLECAGDGVAARRRAGLPGADPYSQATAVTALGGDVLICGAVSRVLLCLLQGSGLRVVPFVAGAVEDVIDGYLAGQLPSAAFAMPGCCGRRGRGRFGRGGRRRWRGGTDPDTPNGWEALR